MKKFKAFTIIELIVVMGIIAVVIALGITAISTSQRATRDQERKVVGGDIQAALDSILRSKGNYPAASNVVFSTNQVSVDGKVIPLTGFKSYSSSSTTASATRYYYSRGTGGYLLCIYLESGGPVRWGYSTSNCP
jgi:prepilin-type N-terminal cleavage/methylation domain-containing protein